MQKCIQTLWIVPFEASIPLESDLLVKKELITDNNEMKKSKRVKITGGLLLPTSITTIGHVNATINEEFQEFRNFTKQDEMYYYFDD